MFDLPPRDATARPGALGELVHRWCPLVGRDQRPVGVRLQVRHVASADGATPTLATLLDAVLGGFATDAGAPFPHGLVVLAPQSVVLDASMLAWRAPRNVVLEVTSAVLADESSLRHLFEVQRHGVRLGLRLAATDAVPDPTRLAVFQYLVVDAARVAAVRASAGAKDCLLLALDGDTHSQARQAFDAGAFGVIGWALVAPAELTGRALAPAQRAVLDLIRQVQADAELEDIENAFKADPVLGYMLLTLANSPAFVRATPIASLRHAITLLGYRRLVKWLVLLLVVASKDARALPQIYCAVARGFLMEQLAIAGGAPTTVQDECFVVGAFSLLGAITGQALPALLDEVKLPDGVCRALLDGDGVLGSLLRLARALEGVQPTSSSDDAALLALAGSANLSLEALNHALLQALAATDALQAVV